MKVKSIIVFAVTVFALFLMNVGPTVIQADEGMIKKVMESCNVSEDQATGGVGAIFSLAKEKMPAEDFTKISDSVPNISKLLAAAPAKDDLASTVSNTASSLTGTAGKLGAAANLAGSFSKLNLDSGMIGKFIPIVVSSVKSLGGDSVGSLLSAVLK